MKDDYFDYYLGGDPPVKKKSNERLWSVLIACLVAAFGPFSFGYGMGYSSAAVTQLENINATDLYLDQHQITWFGVSARAFVINCVNICTATLSY